MTAYVARTWPFADFLLAVDGGPAEGAAEEAAAEEAAAGADDRCLLLSGIVEIEGALVADADQLTRALGAGALSAERLACCKGQFVAVLRSGGRIFLCNDLFGLEHLYVFEDGSVRWVSNRLACLVQQMKAEGLRRRLDAPAVAAGLFTRHHFFRQIHTHRLPVEGVRLVPVDRYLEIDGGRVVEHPRSALVAALAGGEGRRHRLLDEGAAEIVAGVEAAVAAPYFARRTIDLSGGHDSRVTFAAALRSGALAALETTIRDIPGSDDLPIALAIARWAGCRLDQGDEVPRYSKSPRFMMMLWRSFYMGAYHAVSVGPWSRLGTGPPEIRLTGGCGEVYSTFWWKVFGRHLGTARERAALGRLFGSFVNIGRLPAHLRADVEDAFVRSIAELPGRDLAEKVENHYLFFRNRVHFGLAGQNAFGGVVPWAPLIAAPLLAASRRLSIAERDREALKLELLRRLEPTLAFFALDGGRQWPEDALSRLPEAERRRREAAAADGSAELPSWERAQERRVARREASHRQVDLVFTPAELTAFLRREVSTCLDRLRQSDDELRLLLPSPYLDRWFARALDERPRDALHFASKVLAIYDQCLDDDASSLDLGSLPFAEVYHPSDPLHGAARWRAARLRNGNSVASPVAPPGRLR